MFFKQLLDIHISVTAAPAIFLFLKFVSLSWFDCHLFFYNWLSCVVRLQTLRFNQGRLSFPQRVSSCLLVICVSCLWSFWQTFFFVQFALRASCRFEILLKVDESGEVCEGSVSCSILVLCPENWFITISTDKNIRLVVERRRTCDEWVNFSDISSWLEQNSQTMTIREHRNQSLQKCFCPSSLHPSPLHLCTPAGQGTRWPRNWWRGARCEQQVHVSVGTWWQVLLGIEVGERTENVDLLIHLN